MSDGIIIAIIASASSITVAVITVIVKNWLDRKAEAKRHETEDCVSHLDLGEMIYVSDYIAEVRENYEFDRVIVSQFHNGGKFFNGKSMKKFSATYESVSPGISKIKREYQNLLVSEFPQMFSKLLTDDVVYILEGCEECPGMAREMAAQGIVQSVVIPIQGLRGDLVGFISCHNIGESDDRIDPTLTAELSAIAKQLSGYLVKK